MTAIPEFEASVSNDKRPREEREAVCVLGNSLLKAMNSFFPNKRHVDDENTQEAVGQSRFSKCGPIRGMSERSPLPSLRTAGSIPVIRERSSESVCLELRTRHKTLDLEEQ